MLFPHGANPHFAARSNPQPPRLDLFLFLFLLAVIRIPPGGEHLFVNGLVHSLGDQFLREAVAIFQMHVFHMMTEIRDDHVVPRYERHHLDFILIDRMSVSAVEFVFGLPPVFFTEFITPGEVSQFHSTLPDLFGVGSPEPLRMLHDLCGLRMMRTHALTSRTIAHGGKGGLHSREFLQIRRGARTGDAPTRILPA